MSNASKKLAKARAGLILDHPFFGSLALRLELIAVENDPVITTAATDGKVLKYNPAWIEELKLDEIKGVLCHEIMHCANQHHTRRDDRNPEQWNIACDYAINPLIRDCGLALPVGGLLDSHYSGMSAEEIFGKLPQPDPDGEQGDQGSNSGKGNDPGGCGAVMDATGENGDASQAGKDQSAQEWKIALAQAAQQAKAMGELPGSIGRLVEDILEPVLDWREIVRRFVDTAARNDYSWFPPNRRYIAAGLYLPGLQSQELKNVVMAMDTSGSIGGKELSMFEAEVRAIVEDYNANTKVIYCDSEVANVEDFEAGSPIELHPNGGGGTDFRPPFQYVDDHDIEPACFIYQTDGWCDSFPEEPHYPVLWVLTESNRGFHPPFGEVINL